MRENSREREPPNTGKGEVRFWDRETRTSGEENEGAAFAENGNGWKKVENNRTRKRKGKETTDRRGASITSFFMTNLLDYFTGRDLWFACCNMGIITDAFIPNKKARGGSRFGFVRFANVRDPRAMEKALNNIKVDGLKLSANLAKFNKAGMRVDYTPQPTFARKFHAANQHDKGPSKQHHQVANKPSYRDTLVGSKSIGPVRINSPSSCFYLWRKCSVVGEVKDFHSLENIKESLGDLSIYPCEIRYLWGLKIFISFKSSVEAQKFVNNTNSGDLFTSLEICDGQDIARDHLAWIQIRGVPLHLWEASTFDAIGNCIGRVVSNSKASDEDDNLSLCLLGILVQSQNRLEGGLWVECNEKRYDIGFREVEKDWVPEFIVFEGRPEKVMTPAKGEESRMLVQPREVENQPPTCLDSHATGGDFDCGTKPQGNVHTMEASTPFSMHAGPENNQHPSPINLNHADRPVMLPHDPLCSADTLGSDPFGINDLIFTFGA